MQPMPSPKAQAEPQQTEEAQLDVVVLEPPEYFELQLESRVQRASPLQERPLRAAQRAVALPESEAQPEVALVLPPAPQPRALPRQEA